MDEIDFIILKKLLENSRVTIRELAEKIDLSVSSVHKRINKLIEDEVILGFSARPSLIALKYLLVLIFGTCKTRSINAVTEELGQHENIVNIAIASGKFLYIAGFLRDITGLRDYSAYVSNTAQISDPTIGIIDVPYMTTPEPLSGIDYKILKSINRDARKPVIDIADDIGVSTKTVRKRLDRMVENNLIRFGIEWSDKGENNLTTGFHLNLREGTNLDSLIKHLYEKYADNIMYCACFSNIPNFIIMYTWTRNTQESQKIEEELQTEGFQDVIPHLVISSKFFDSWVDQLLRTK